MITISLIIIYILALAGIYIIGRRDGKHQAWREQDKILREMARVEEREG